MVTSASVRPGTGYEVGNLAETRAKAKRVGATILVTPSTADKRNFAVVPFPGGYIAENPFALRVRDSAFVIRDCSILIILVLPSEDKKGVDSTLYCSRWRRWRYPRPENPP